MKPEIHPEYHDVVFEDSSANPAFRVKTRSTRVSEETIEWEDGNTYPLVKVEISSATHPFYTGKMMLIDTAGMVERYRKRYGLPAAEEAQDPESATAEAEPTEAADQTAEPAAEAQPVAEAVEPAAEAQPVTDQTEDSGSTEASEDQ